VAALVADCPLLIHHAANNGHPFPPSSLAGIAACLEAGALAIEIDVHALADGDFALLHDAQLEHATTGQGLAGAHTGQQVSRLRLLAAGKPTDHPVATLSQVVALLHSKTRPPEVQIDLKIPPAQILTEGQLCSLAQLLRPLGTGVRVSSPADWNLRRLHAVAPDLSLGFDPYLYLDAGPRRGGGAYGYRDKHPLAREKWGLPVAYLAERAELLWMQLPYAQAWYIRGTTLARALDDGFDWVHFLHERGVIVSAWTLDAAYPRHVETARQLLEAGVDRIASNNPRALADALGGGVVF